MDITQPMTVEEVLEWRRNTPRETFFASGSLPQKQRDAWCVARFCEILHYGGSLNLLNEEPTDIELRTVQGFYKIQVTEAKEQKKRFELISKDWSSEEILYLILERIKAKITYDKNSLKEMTLLVYVNLGNGDGSRKFWKIDKVKLLENDSQTYPFKNVVIFDSIYGAFFVKGSV